LTAPALIRPLSSIAWELRSAWASGRRVSLTLGADEDRVEGHVQRVAATGAFVVVRSLHVPMESVLAVHHPSRLGDSTATDDERWRGRRHREPQAERLWAA
jgi:hypothetical protein